LPAPRTSSSRRSVQMKCMQCTSRRCQPQSLPRFHKPHTWTMRSRPAQLSLEMSVCGAFDIRSQSLQAWSQASGPDEVKVEEVEDDMLGSPASMKASPSLPALPGRARASFGEDLRNGYESRARDREAWLSSLSSQQALPEDAPVQRMTAKELLALANVPDASPGRSLREPSDVFNEQLKRWNVQMKAKDGGEDRWNGNVRMTWSIRMS
ncbi:unnamed protein product, partial [Symbiodinium sp. KB8]